MGWGRLAPPSSPTISFVATDESAGAVLVGWGASSLASAVGLDPCAQGADVAVAALEAGGHGSVAGAGVRLWFFLDTARHSFAAPLFFFPPLLQAQPPGVPPPPTSPPSTLSHAHAGRLGSASLIVSRPPPRRSRQRTTKAAVGWRLGGQPRAAGLGVRQPSNGASLLPAGEGRRRSHLVRFAPLPPPTRTSYRGGLGACRDHVVGVSGGPSGHLGISRVYSVYAPLALVSACFPSHRCLPVVCPLKTSCSVMIPTSVAEESELQFPSSSRIRGGG